MLAHGWQTIPERSMVRSHEPIKFWSPPTISLEQLNLKSSNFVYRWTVSNPSLGDKPHLKGAWFILRNPFFKFCPNHIFVIGEAWYFKFLVLIYTGEYE